MIFEINCGHCVNGKFDGGAIGNGLKEQDLTRLVGNLVMAKLKANGHTVINCTVDSADSVNDALKGICAKANAVKADMFISIHFNAFNNLGHGTEVLTFGGKEIKEARNILNNIVSLGYVNRGIKDGSHLYVIKNTHATAMLVECCFIDNEVDIKLFNAEKMADAIVHGLIGEIAIIKPVVTPSTKPIIKVDPTILKLQKVCNKLGVTDSQGKSLIEDGITGAKTEAAKVKLKSEMQIILK